MKPTPWSQTKALKYGAIFGLLMPIPSLLGVGEPLSTAPAYLGFYFVGSMLGGAILFAAASAIRNLLIK